MRRIVGWPTLATRTPPLYVGWPYGSVARTRQEYCVFRETIISGCDWSTALDQKLLATVTVKSHSTPLWVADRNPPPPNKGCSESQGNPGQPKTTCQTCTLRVCTVPVVVTGGAKRRDKKIGPKPFLPIVWQP
jgi:hypothetical protein